MVAGLNAIRDATWDKSGEFAALRFVRQAQTFPDVILKPAAPPHVQVEPVMGIELKGWYVLAKEGVPSFRYKVTPKAAAPADLVAVFPWALTQVISGSPQLFEPFVVSARYAAEFRNWWWEHERAAKRSPRIRLSSHEGYYPLKSDLTSDVPEEDAGNFGRIARTKIFHRDGYIDATFAANLSGIPLHAWRSFFEIFSERTTEVKIRAALTRMAAEVEKKTTRKASDQAKTISALQDQFEALAATLDDL